MVSKSYLGVRKRIVKDMILRETVWIENIDIEIEIGPGPT